MWIKLNLCLDSVSFEWIEFTEMDLISKSGEREQWQWNGIHRTKPKFITKQYFASYSSFLLHREWFWKSHFRFSLTLLHSFFKTTFVHFERESINWIWFAKCCYKWCSFVYLDTEFLERKSSFILFAPFLSLTCCDKNKMVLGLQEVL